MEFSEALPFLEENHMAVVTTIGQSGRAQSTVVSAAPLNGRMAFVSREGTSKVRNIRRGTRCAVTLIKPDTRRYVTVEGPATAQGFGDTDEAELLDLMGAAYVAAGRSLSAWDDFAGAMKEQQRAVLLVTPERVYGST